MASNGNTRRMGIIAYLQRQTCPVSGSELAKQFGVSRQVIVQDIALLRAENRAIVATNKGYKLFHSQEKHNGCTAVISVRHSAEQALEEMRSIVDYGGSILDVFIEHDLYGQIRVDMVINDAEDADEFFHKLKKSRSGPIKEFIEGCHYHTIAAPTKETLGLIRKELLEKGILAEEMTE